MELLAWAVYGAFLIVPYVIGFAAFCCAAFLLPKYAFSISRRTGIVVSSVIALGIGYMAIRYLVIAPQEFNAACAAGVGLHISKPVRANSYTLEYVENFGDGYLNNTDTTIAAAIAKVASRKVDFVEIQDSLAPGPYYNAWGSLKQYKTSSQDIGYFKVSRSTVASGRCRWLMLEDVKPLDYELYTSYKAEYEKNQVLLGEDKSRECVSVEYIQTPTSRYLISFSIKKKISDNLVKHEIRVIDRGDNNAVIGSNVAYEHIAKGVYGSVAFWLSNGKRHPRCPVNLLFEDKTVQKVLGV